MGAKTVNDGTIKQKQSRELFIEELEQVSGGETLYAATPITTLAHGEEGVMLFALLLQHGRSGKRTADPY